MQATVQDIEDLVVLGKEMHVCPYYGTRSVIPQAEVGRLVSVLILTVSSAVLTRSTFFRLSLSPTISSFKSLHERRSAST